MKIVNSVQIISAREFDSPGSVDRAKNRVGESTGRALLNNGLIHMETMDNPDTNGVKIVGQVFVMPPYEHLEALGIAKYIRTNFIYTNTEGAMINRLIEILGEFK